MRKENLIITCVVIIILAIFFLSFYISNYNNKTYDTKTSTGAVTIDITPKEFKNGEFYIDIKLNTHTVNMESYDLKEITTLNYDDKIAKPVMVPHLEGHHNSGTLVFNLDKEPKKFTIKIIGILDVNERLFEWK
ncbi:hypothetical protein J4230_03515 [Candidatus Woesearchaeota archaeon]|nr:hypothetical protein [Candidatus Woesearchaeota archaeon]